MRSICEIIHNLRQHKAPRKLSTSFTGFVRKITAKFHGVLLIFTRRKATAAMSTIPVDEDLNLGLLQDVDCQEEHYETSPFSTHTDLQKDSEAETTPIYPTPAGVDKQVKKPKKGLLYCTICRDYYPEFCRSPVEHGNKAEEYKYCQHCYKNGDHKTAMCPNKPKLRVLVCSVCEYLYPCKNQEEHGNKGVEVNNFCCHCFRTGHMPQECTEEYDPTLTLNG